MLVFALSGLSEVELDMQAIAIAAARLGPDAAELWRSLCARAAEEVRKGS